MTPQQNTRIIPDPVPRCRSLRSLSRRSVEEEFPHLYAHGCTLRDICADCTKFIADVISSSRRSLDILNNTPKRTAGAAAAAAAAVADSASASAERPHSPRHSRREARAHPPLPPHHLQPQQGPQTSSPSPSQLRRYANAETINRVNQ